MRVPFRTSSGFSLVELMVALVAGLIVSGAVLSFFLASTKSNGEYVQSTRLTQELRNTMDLLSRDVRRAGYDDNGLKYLGQANTSPFTPMCISAGSSTACVGSGSSGDCVIYAYDRTNPNGSTTASGTPGTLDVSNGEVRGLRRVTATVNGIPVGIIEYATSAGVVKPTCDDATATYTSFPPTCSASNIWCPLSDPTRVDITALAITNQDTVIGTNPSALVSRKLDIKLVGRLPGNTEYTRDVQTSLKIRSDCMRADFANCRASP